jgi:hypothetical protein
MSERIVHAEVVHKPMSWRYRWHKPRWWFRGGPNPWTALLIYDEQKTMVCYFPNQARAEAWLRFYEGEVRNGGDPVGRSV